jgi:hypothetical protein
MIEFIIELIADLFGPKEPNTMPLDYEVMEKVVGKDKQDKTENSDADDSENMEDISNG